MTKVIFLLFCYFFEKTVSGYLHVSSQNNVINSLIIIDIFSFFFNRNFHICDGKLIRTHKN